MMTCFLFIWQKKENVYCYLYRNLCLFSTQRLTLTCIYQTANFSVALTKKYILKEKERNSYKLCLLNKSNYFKYKYII